MKVLSWWEYVGVHGGTGLYENIIKKAKMSYISRLWHIECILLVKVSAVGLGMSLVSFFWKKVSGHMKKVRIYGVLIRQF